MTDAFNDARLPTWFKLLWWVAGPLARWAATPREEIGERILFLATSRFPARQVIEGGVNAKDGEGDAGIAMGTDGIRGSGAYAVNWDGETISTEKAYKTVREEGLAEKVWEHTMTAFREIEAGNVFTG